MDYTLIIILISTSLVLLIFLNIAVIIYGENIIRSKEIVGTGLEIVLPTVLKKQLNNLDLVISELTKEMEKSLLEEKKHTNEAEKLTKSSMGHIKEAKETFLLFEKIRTQLESEINHYKEGAENKQVHKFLRKFIGFRNYMQEEVIKSENNVQTKEVVKGLLEYYDYALQDYEVEVDQPMIGKNYNDYDFLDETPLIENTIDPNKDYEIKEIITPAFFLKGIGGQKNYISKSKVVIFKFKGESNGKNNRD